MSEQTPSNPQSDTLGNTVGDRSSANSGAAKPSLFDRLRGRSAAEPAPQPAAAARSLGARLRSALGRTGSGLSNLLLGARAIDDELFEELETQLLMADVGVEVTAELLATITQRVARDELRDSDQLQRALMALMVERLERVEAPLQLTAKPFVILVVGVNGVGKTTTIGKLAHRYQADGQSVMLAAGDTFRAAAVEQLQAWGERNSVPVIAQQTGADSASVVFDAVQAARARNTDLLIADTAGRLHNKGHLMEELAKVHRVLGKLDSEAPHEVLLVLDAGTGQNAVAQMREFHKAAGVTGLAVTKLDGTAKGGVLLALAAQFGVPVRYIGVGEAVDDLQPFDAEQFVAALWGVESTGASSAGES